MDDTITLIATQDGQAFTDAIKLLDVLVVATAHESRKPLASVLLFMIRSS